MSIKIETSSPAGPQWKQDQQQNLTKGKVLSNSCQAQVAHKTHDRGAAHRVLQNTGEKNRRSSSQRERLQNEGWFTDQLLRFMVAPERVSGYLKQVSDTRSEKEELVASLQRDFERSDRDCDTAFELYKTGGLSVQQFKERYQPLDARKQEIAAELPRLQGELDALRIATLSEEYLTKEVNGLHARWPNMDQEERRLVIEQIVTEISVGTEQISIKFSHLPAFEQMTNGQRMV